MNGMNGFAEPLLVDWLAQLEPHWRLALFALAGVVAGLGLDVVIRRVPAAVERAWREEMQAADFAREPFTAASGASGAAAPSARCDSDAPDFRRAGAAHQSDHPCVALTYGAYLCEPGLALSAMAPHRRWQLSALAGVLSAAIGWRFGPTWQSLGALALVWTLIALAYIDYDTQLLPDILTLPLLWAGLLCNLGHWFAALPSAVIGAAAGYLSLWALYWVYWWLRRREGMGFGDFKLYAALGAWFGWSALLQIITLACLLAIGVAGAAWLAGRLRSDQMFPFGAFLAAAGMITLFGGNGLMIWIGGTP
ncbi:Type 4 prepilin-like proteins leader peptide-processing enzyme [Pandoraea morbifera]|uniref:Type 4 prepilin-like proteins leader peptide-processing enzyme n=1 Tax=Pandoraea morbifera TaxID=2508300 RepID=A0A5E4UGY7_9BURK|nr:A24 family peptidase [Pandoraea morbifera]VVD98164.1 Type 4 prepilin-like proteins leader peptide-processing enzyme [Pandoraea morbifera]